MWKYLQGESTCKVEVLARWKYLHSVSTPNDVSICKVEVRDLSVQHLQRVDSGQWPLSLGSEQGSFISEIARRGEVTF